MIMNTASIRRDYEALAQVLDDMAKSAEISDADQLAQCQARHDEIMARIRAHDVHLADVPDHEQLAQTIRRSIDTIKRFAPKIKAMQDELVGEASTTRMHRKVAQSYR